MTAKILYLRKIFKMLEDMELLEIKKCMLLQCKYIPITNKKRGQRN